jgi:hypothetical protein
MAEQAARELEAFVGAEEEKKPVSVSPEEARALTVMCIPLIALLFFLMAVLAWLAREILRVRCRPRLEV